MGTSDLQLSWIEVVVNLGISYLKLVSEVGQSCGAEPGTGAI